ncbi:hypothetical protein LWI29_019019 [Acer saccharum]|uniref:Uncharacterized protein n=1 Tax=Acer saccharum TaxID=4024 RepID=A0AA39SP41_ACESA|nr:hypothetical protein LWI29_019019 [Acer saccharum]
MKNKIRERNVDVAPYLALYQAIRKKNWKDVEEFVTKHPDALHDDITATGKNIFHFLSTALDLMEQYPELASTEVAPNEGSRYWKANFDMMVTKPQIYASGSRLGFWHSFIYKCWFPLQSFQIYASGSLSSDICKWESARILA